MAGNYMDAPGKRLAYDRDGTIGVVATSAGLATQLTSTQLVQMNSETETGMTVASGTSFQKLALVFPVPVDLKAIFLAPLATSYTFLIETSLDTTTGLDGTWTAQGNALVSGNVRPNYRIASNLTVPGVSNAALAIRGIRLTSTTSTINQLKAFHVYADTSASATTDRLSFWMPTTDAKVPANYFDWGNVPRSTTADIQFRLKNLSGTLNANNINAYVESLTPGSPTISGMHLLSADGGSTFAPSITLATIAPGAISPLLVLRRVVPANAQISVWSARVAADVTTWA